MKMSFKVFTNFVNNLKDQVNYTDPKTEGQYTDIINNLQDKIDNIEQKIESYRTQEKIPVKVEEEVSKEEVLEEEIDEEAKADIKEFFKEELDEDVESTSPNLSINKKGKPERVNKLKPRIIKIAKASAKSIAKLLPGTRIVLHESSSEFFKYTNTKGNGYFNPITNTIHIDLSKAHSVKL